MIKKIELDFGVISVYDRILISELHEGVLLNVENNRQILNIGCEEFKTENFGYISHRINSYAVDPMVYRESAELEQLKAIAVVSKNDMALKSAELEKKFYTNRNSFAIFKSLEEATAWIKSTVGIYSKEKSLSS